jgi:hypothetical protein
VVSLVLALALWSNPAFPRSPAYGDDDEYTISVQDFFTGLGVTFPEGAFATYIQRAGYLLITNTVPNLEKITRIMSEINITPTMLDISVYAVSLPMEQAAAWGLDGLPPADPRATPLGRRIPPFLSPEQTATLFRAIRETPGANIIGTARGMNLSGNTMMLRCVSERQLTADDAGTKEAQDVGVILEATPTLADDWWHVNLELSPRISAFTADGANAETPPVIRAESQLRITLVNGETALIGSLQQATAAEEAMGADGPSVMLLFAHVELVPVGQRYPRVVEKLE